MKKILLFVLGSTLGLTLNAQGILTSQIQPQVCNMQAGANILVWCENMPVGPVNFYVDWGNGDIDTSGNFYFNPPNGYGISTPLHNTTYTSPGFYNVTCWAQEPSSSVQIAISQATVAAFPLDSLTAGNVEVFTGYSNVPVDFIDANGITTTILPQNNSDAYFGLNLNNIPYTVSINDSWLAANGLEQSDPDAAINNFYSFGCAEAASIYFNLTCITSNPIPDLSIDGYDSPNFSAPLQSGGLHLDICNLSCFNTASTTTVSVTFPSSFVPDISNLSNPSVNGNILTFDVDNLTGCESLSIPFSFPGATPAGTIVCFPVSLTSAVNEVNISNNIDTICVTITNSFDPNDKQVNQPTNIQYNNQEDFRYTIRFQNDGNDFAHNVLIKDTLDSDLDINTFEVVFSNHSVATTIDYSTRVVTFTFGNINLWPSSQDLTGSQGYVVYNIREAANLAIGSEIENTAYIYFDFNPPIITNTTYNINTVLAVDINENEFIEMYPNPAQNTIVFNGAVVKSVQIIDLAGKTVLLTSSLPSNNLSIDELTNGMYHVILETEKGTQKLKLVVSK